jgi:hypothetical protein
MKKSIKNALKKRKLEQLEQKRLARSKPDKPSKPNKRLKQVKVSSHNHPNRPPPDWKKKLIRHLDFESFTVGPYTVIDVDTVSQKNQQRFIKLRNDFIKLIPTKYYCGLKQGAFNWILEKEQPQSTAEFDALEAAYDATIPVRTTGEQLYADGILNFGIVRTVDNEPIGGFQMVRNQVISGSLATMTFSIKTTPFLFLVESDISTGEYHDLQAILIRKLLNWEFHTTTDDITMVVEEVELFSDNTLTYGDSFLTASNQKTTVRMAQFPDIVAVPVDLGGGTIVNNFRKVP